MEIDEERLIEEVRSRDFIWDKSSHLYTNKRLKLIAFQKISEILQCDIDSIKKKWVELQKRFKEENEKVELSYRSGNGLKDVYVSIWPFYEILSFLKSSVEPRKTKGNLSHLFEKNDKEEEIANSFLEKTKSNEKKMSFKNKESPSKTMMLEGCTVQSDFGHKLFYKSLIPFVKMIHQDDILPYREELSRITHKYAHKRKKNQEKNKKIECIVIDEDEDDGKCTPKKKKPLIKSENIKEEGDRPNAMHPLDFCNHAVHGSAIHPHPPPIVYCYPANGFGNYGYYDQQIVPSGFQVPHSTSAMKQARIINAPPYHREASVSFPANPTLPTLKLEDPNTYLYNNPETHQSALSLQSQGVQTPTSNDELQDVHIGNCRIRPTALEPQNLQNDVYEI